MLGVGRSVMLRFIGQVVFSMGLLLLALVAVQWVAYDTNFIIANW